MKKTIAILSAIAALVACAKEAPIPEDSVQNNNQTIKLNITVTRTETADTKATVKADFADGDVIFLFFNKAAAPKHVKLTYDKGEWSANVESIDLADISASANMTAVYLPYSTGYTVTSTAYNYFKIRNAAGDNYCGHFYKSERQGFSFDGETLTATIPLTVMAPSSGEDRLVHFDISGFESGHKYILRSNYLKKQSFLGITVSNYLCVSDESDPDKTTVGSSLEDIILGYEDTDNGIISFSGILDASAVGNAVNYEFLITDLDGDAYYRVVNGKTISGNKYISLGDITTWSNKYERPFFSVEPMKLVAFAPGNLVLTVSDLDGKGVPSTATWSFATNQYDYVGSTGVNQYISGNGTFSQAGKFDLFGWVGTSSTVLTGDLSKYGVSNSTASLGIGADDAEKLANGNVYGRQLDDALKSDWGNTISDGNPWRTLSIYEWRYLLTNRFHASQKWGGATVNSVKGIIILPDTFTDPKTNSATVDGSFDSGAGWAKNTYDVSGWGSMQTAGATFLPAAGYRNNGTTVASAGSIGTYHTSTPKEVDGSGNYDNYYEMDPKTANNAQDHAYYFRIQDSGNIGLTNSGRRKMGRSVRLVRDLN